MEDPSKIIDAEVLKTISDDEIANLASEMREVEDLADMAKQPVLGNKAIRKLQLNAFRISNKARRLGKHVINVSRIGRFQKQADNYYTGLGNIRIPLLDGK